VECLRIGETMRDRLQIRCGAETWVDASVAQLKAPWSGVLEDQLMSDTASALLGS
jgi:hypothetical protein